MSGAEIVVVAPASVVLAPIALAAAGAGLAAALAVRAAAAGTEAAGRALEQFGDEVARRADAQDDLAVRGRLWDLAAGSAAAVNMELRLLSARAEKAGVRVALPAVVDLTGQELTGTRRRMAEAQKALAGARAQIEKAEATLVRQDLLAKLPAPAGDSPTAAETLARHLDVLTRRLTPPAVVAQPVAPDRVDTDRVQAEIDAALLRLDADATAADRAEALLLASHAARQKTVGSSRTYLGALTRKVEKDLNPRIAGRREAAALLDALEHPVVTAMINDLAPPLPPCLGSIGRLRAVVRGDEELTDELRRDGRGAVAWAQTELDRRRLREGLAEAFAGLGYSVTTGLGVKLSVTKNAWHDYTADVWVDESGRVHSHLVQESPDAAGEADRCVELNNDLRQVGAQLDRHGRGAHVDVPQQLKPAIKRFRPGTARKGSSVPETTLKQRHATPEEHR